MDYLTYSLANGQILSVGSTQSLDNVFIDPLNEGKMEQPFPIVDISLYYIDLVTLEVVAHPAKIILTVTQDGNTITLNNTATISLLVDETPYTIDPGVTIQFIHVGIYRMSFNNPAFVQFYQNVEVTTPYTGSLETPTVVYISKTSLIEAARQALYKEVDNYAEYIRGFLITAGSGQAMVYMRKEREAELFVADNEISLALVPHVVAEAEVLDVTPLAAAQVILQQRDLWLNFSPALEKARRNTKVAIENLDTLEEISAISVIGIFQPFLDAVTGEMA